MLAKCFSIAAVILLFSGMALADEPPNVLIIMADDCTYNDLPLYGGENAKTPNIDQLASQGLTFNKAYLSSAMCQPCRAELYSGQYPMRNGCAWNHSSSRPETTSIPQHLGKLGYRVGIAGKVHVKPKKAFPFEDVGGFCAGCVRNPTLPHDVSNAKTFMMRDKTQPFCLVIALVEPHIPWVMGDASQYPSAKLKLPPHLADTPRTRKDYSAYLAEITYMDSQVGDILKALEQSGQADNTVVLFTSEQGSQFPGCKWTSWDLGVHTALVARWPGQIQANQRTNALVQYADVLPTLIDLAGANVDADTFDGTSFKDVLLGESDTHRKFAYGAHNNTPEGPPYPIRTVTDGEYRLIRNLLHNEIYIEKHLMGIQGVGGLNNPYWPTWIAEAHANQHTYDLVKRYMRRPPVEFYHTTEDPFEMTNMLEPPRNQWPDSLSDRMETLSKALDEWLEDQQDPGIPQDTKKAHQAAKQGMHLFGVK